MSERVAITGIGIISAIGNNVPENLDSLTKLKAGVAPIQHLQTRLKDSHVAAEVKASNEELIELAGLASFDGLTRTILLGIIAAKEAIAHAGLDNKQLANTSFYNGTTVGGMDVSERYYEDYINGNEIDIIRAFGSHDCGYVTEKIADVAGVKHNVTTISTACSSSANTIMLAGRKIKSGQEQCIIAGGTDALSLFTLNGFNTLFILDPEHCKPFDENRKGLNLGEAGAYLVLENEEHAKARGAKILAYIAGYGNANDAFHQTASSDEGVGATMAMKDAFNVADVDPKTIDYINVHGTGTSNNDLSEGVALKNIFGDNLPLFSSTKPFTGHTLGAAGAVEAVFSVLSMQHNLAYANLNFQQAIEEINVRPLSENKTLPAINSVLSNSFGFGGNCTSLIFEK